MEAVGLGIGSWAPDGRSVAFAAGIAGNTDIYTLAVEGGKPVRLTFAPSIERSPEWSRDGQWIYYSSTATGQIPEIWKIPANGGAAQQITHGGGFEPRFSPDGRYVYYLDRPPKANAGPGETSKLLRMPAAGGDPTAIHEAVPAHYWSVAANGIYFLTAEITRPSRRLYLDLYRFEDEKVVRVGELPFRVGVVPGRFTVSPDGRWALTNQRVRYDCDLMLLENVR
jgi:dipeptidyl aminopeptidase/acylaminoacyl peptidase